MADRPPVIYGLEFQGRTLTARALAAKSSEEDKIFFLCGTQSLRYENQVHLLEYDEDTGVLDKVVFAHPAGEIWHISTSSNPTAKDIFCTCYGKFVDGKSVVCAAMWRLKEGGAEHSPLDQVCELPHASNVRCTCWHPELADQLVSIDDKKLTSWKITESDVKELSHLVLEEKTQSQPTYSALCWNSHQNCSQVLYSTDLSIRSWDMREKPSKQSSVNLEQPHGSCVRSLDFNPNKPQNFASCGDDCTVKFWDARKSDQPLLVQRNHSHWIWSVQFNHIHDQLVLTAGSDCQVVLARVASIASEPLKHTDDNDTDATTSPPAKDEVVQVYQEHEDSVYSAKWSLSDAWVFASLSYDGRLVISHVPSSEKFRILTL
eukprot:Em0004g1386a